METIQTIYNAVPPYVWAFVFGTPFIVAFVNTCKKVFGVNSTIVIHSLNVTTGFILANGAELLSHNPKPLLFNAAFTTGFFTAANFLYAASKKLQPFFAAVEQYEQKKAVARTTALVADPAPAAAPATVPVADSAVFEG